MSNGATFLPGGRYLTTTFYDGCSYGAQMEMSRGPGQRQLNYIPPEGFEERNLNDAWNVRYSAVSRKACNQANQVTTENQLKGLTTKINYGETQIQTPNAPQTGSCTIRRPLTTESFGAEHTRWTNPANNMKGRGFNRSFETLPYNPQFLPHVLGTRNIGTDTISMMKDNHVPCVPTPPKHSRYQVGDDAPRQRVKTAFDRYDFELPPEAVPFVNTYDNNILHIAKCNK